MKSGMAADPTTITDQALAAAVGGDERAIGEIWRAWNPRLLRFFRARRHEDADDLAAAVWLDIARRLPHFDGDGQAFRRWLFTLAHRRLIDAARADARRPKLVALDHDRKTDDPTTYEDLEWALGLLQELPVDQATAISLRILADLTAAEVGEIMGRTAGSVRVLTHRGGARLRELLDASRENQPTL